MVTGLDLLFLEVNNLEESLVFYQERLGFEIVSLNLAAAPPIGSVGAGSLRITLVQQLETMLKRGRGVHFVLGVSNVDEFHAKLKASGVDEGSITDVTNDYVSLKVKIAGADGDLIIILLHSIESVLPRTNG